MSFLQFVAKKWWPLTLWTVGWAVMNFVVIKRLPIWAQIAVYGLVIIYFAYEYGVITERGRQLRQHIRLCEELAEMHELMAVTITGVRRDADEIKRTFELLELKIKPKAVPGRPN